MKISCPHCHSVYSLEDSAVPAQGRDVQCIKCQTVWNITPDQPLLLVPEGAEETAMSEEKSVEAAASPLSTQAPSAKAEPAAADVVTDDLDERIDRLESLLNSSNVSSRRADLAFLDYEGVEYEMGMMPVADIDGEVDRSKHPFMQSKDSAAESYEFDEEAAGSDVASEDPPSQSENVIVPFVSRRASDDKKLQDDDTKLNELDSQNITDQANSRVKGRKSAAQARSAAKKKQNQARKSEKDADNAQEAYISDAVNKLSQNILKPKTPVAEETSAKAIHDEAEKLETSASTVQAKEKSEAKHPSARKKLPEQPAKEATSEKVENKPSQPDQNAEKVTSAPPARTPKKRASKIETSTQGKTAENKTSSAKSEKSELPQSKPAPDTKQESKLSSKTKAETAASSEVSAMRKLDDDVPPMLMRRSSDEPSQSAKSVPPAQRKELESKKQINLPAEPTDRSPFWTGFIFVLVAVLLLFGLRYLAEPIVETFPSTKIIITEYATIFDRAQAFVTSFFDRF